MASIVDVLRGVDGCKIGDKVTVRGWVRSRRDSKAGVSFIALSDGSCFSPLQVVAPQSLENYGTEVQKVTTGCSLEVTGAIVESQGAGQAVELLASAVRVVGWVDDPDTYPVSQKRHTFEYLRDVAHLRPRTATFGAIARIRHCIAMAIHRFFDERGFYWVHTPLITASDCEGAGETFQVSTLDFMNIPRTESGEVDYSKDFFGKKASLTVSGQLEVETHCCALSKVYTFGPTFRAENSNTSRHLSEFWMVEPEIAFADLNDVASLAEDFLKAIFTAVLRDRADDMAFFDAHVEKGVVERLQKIVDAQFKRIEYTDAIKILQAAPHKFEFAPEWGKELQSEHERYLTEEHFKAPVIVMNYPRKAKAFYMRVNDDGQTVAAMDVLAPGIGEIIGGSQREERLDKLDERIAEMGLNPDDYSWYRDLRRYGTVPHGGFGLGFDRIVMFCTGMANIRDVIPFARTPRNCNF